MFFWLLPGWLISRNNHNDEFHSQKTPLKDTFDVDDDDDHRVMLIQCVMEKIVIHFGS